MKDLNIDVSIKQLWDALVQIEGKAALATKTATLLFKEGVDKAIIEKCII
jgi:hypothetical protein